MDQYTVYTRGKRKGWIKRRLVLSALENAVWMDTGGSRKFRAHLLNAGVAIRRPNLEAIASEYNLLCSRLEREFETVHHRTFEEDMVVSYIQSQTQLHFLRGAWISNFNIDIFVPSIGPENLNNGSPVMRGLAIEVDGPVHDRTFKMHKDEHKAEGLMKLGIGLTVIRNDDLRHGYWRTVVDGVIRHRRRLGHRTRQNLFRRIYLESLAYHSSDSLSALYECNFDALVEKAGEFLRELGR